MFSLVFSLIDANKKSARGNALDDLLHTVSTIPPHLSRDMAVNVQSKRSRGVAQIFLHRFDVISTLDCQNRIGVPQIVEAGRGRTNFDHDSLEAIIDGAVGKKATSLIGENKAVFLPAIPGFQTQPIWR